LTQDKIVLSFFVYAPFVIPSLIKSAADLADSSWHPALLKGLGAMNAIDPTYLAVLGKDSFLPTKGRLFAAFMQPLNEVRYVLVGEGPYPREASATGVCFMDGAVQELWSAQGLSKPVNRATSLRNFMKMLMVADGLLAPESTGGESVAVVSAHAMSMGSGFIQTLPDLQHNLTDHGFLLLNAALVFRSDVPPVKEAKAWRPLLETVLEALADRPGLAPPTLVLWGRIAQWLEDLPIVSHFPRSVAEHPYNLSFIQNQAMQGLFGPMHLLRAPESAPR
jgi:uracil-DNA glycosylase